MDECEPVYAEELLNRLRNWLPGWKGEAEKRKQDPLGMRREWILAVTTNRAEEDEDKSADVRASRSDCVFWGIIIMGVIGSHHGLMSCQFLI